MTRAAKCWGAAIIGWILLPAVLGLLGGLVIRSGILSHPSPNALYLFGRGLYGAICIAVEILIIRMSIIQGRRYGATMFFAALLQLFLPLAVSLLVSHLNGSFNDNSFMFGLVLYGTYFAAIVIQECAILILVAVTLFILRKTRFSQHTGTLLSAAALGSLILLGIIKPSLAMIKFNIAHSPLALATANYNVSAVEFRQDEKAQTTLGKLPRPLKIYRKENEFFGIDPKGNRIELPFMENVDTDENSMFFDVYSDRIYYEQGGDVFMLDVNTRQIIKLPVAFSDALKEQNCSVRSPGSWCNTRHILGSHNDELALGFQGDVAVINIVTGERHNTSFEGPYTEGLYFFWANSKAYRLFVDSHPEKKEDGYPKTDEQLGNILWIYFDDKGEEYHVLTDEDLDSDRWGSVIYGGGERSYFFAQKTPIVTLKTDFPSTTYFADNESRFSIRELYLLNDKSIGLVIEKRLIVIDLETQTGNVLTDEKEIGRLIQNASLLSLDYTDYASFQCIDHRAIDQAQRDAGAEDIFCLQ
jgi:hypothetical protein